MKDILFSIIVPIYNVEKYLEDCLESILTQPYQNYEVICINDASTDNSYKILSDIAKEHRQIKIINNEVNGGLSYSRNRGIEAAKGDYILFVDSDDYIAKETLEVLANNLQENSVDFLNFNYTLKKECALEERDAQIPQIRGKDILPRSGQKWFMDALYGNSLIIMTWSRVYKKSFLVNNHLTFYNRLLHEDLLFLLQAVIKAKTVISIDNCLYFYRKRENSITTTKNEVRLDSIVVLLCEILALIRTNILEEGMEKALCSYMSRSWPRLMRALIMSFPSHTKMEIGGSDAQVLFSFFQALCGGESFGHISFNQKELKIIQSFERRIVYGAGMIGSELLMYFQNANIYIQAVAVSNKEGNTERIAGYKVQQIDELIEFREEALVIVAVSKRNQEAIRLKLEKMGFKNILVPDTDRKKIM